MKKFYKNRIKQTTPINEDLLKSEKKVAKLHETKQPKQNYLVLD